MNDTNNLFERASRSIVGGVNSPVRAFKSVGGNPMFAKKASGAYIWDVNDVRRVDYVGSWGPMIAGHAHPDVTNKISEIASLGTSYGISTKIEIELAEEVKKRMPSIEKIRFVNSGSEAAMSAVRLARAYTKKDKIIKFAGCYHGHADSFLVSAGSGAATLGLPNSPGVTSGSAQDTLIAEFNDIENVAALFADAKDEIAAVILEPITGNMGVILPEDGFFKDLRKLCDANDALLIFDEVMTGFRVARGGAQEIYNVKPDLTLLGKIIGGGLPVGAFGGASEIMELLAPSGPVYQAGTLSGNPLAMGCGLATLNLLTDEAYARLEESSKSIEETLVEETRRNNIPAQIPRKGSMATLFFSEVPVKNFTGAQNADHRKFAKFFRSMFDNGVLLPPSGYESWFVSLAHDENALDLTTEAIKKSLKDI